MCLWISVKARGLCHESHFGVIREHFNRIGAMCGNAKQIHKVMQD